MMLYNPNTYYLNVELVEVYSLLELGLNPHYLILDARLSRFLDRGSVAPPCQFQHDVKQFV